MLDASALLALLFFEPGEDVVAEALGQAVVSTVNWLEVCQRVAAQGGQPGVAGQTLSDAGLEFVPLSLTTAEAAAALRTSTRSAGLSLADRCCLALAAERDVPALTADAAWAQVQTAAEVRLIR